MVRSEACARAHTHTHRQSGAGEMCTNAIMKMRLFSFRPSDRLHWLSLPVSREQPLGTSLEAQPHSQRRDDKPQSANTHLQSLIEQ